MTAHECRACRAKDGHGILDLGDQPAADHFPAFDDPGPDPVYPLQMWLCSACGLAQLRDDPTTPEEPRGAEPAALVEQAADAVGRVAAAGWLSAPGSRVAEYGSPHGGSWLRLLTERGLTVADEHEQARVVVDCFGLMHAADQRAAVAERATRVAPDGVLLLQYHSLVTIVRHGQWNSLRHGHYAYYSTTALVGMLATAGFVPLSAWHFELYRGTVLLAATRDGHRSPVRNGSVSELLANENAIGVTNPERLQPLQDRVVSDTDAVHRWLLDQHAAGMTVLGYGAASRAVALLSLANVDRALLPAIADASSAKQGRRMPATDIPIVDPHELVTARPDVVLLFLPDLLDEVRGKLPQIEAAGGRWVSIDDL